MMGTGAYGNDRGMAMVDGLRDTTLAALQSDLSYGVRVDRTRMVAEQADDLARFVEIATAMLPGSMVVDQLRAGGEHPELADLTSTGDAEDRIAARHILAALTTHARAAQLTGDTPGLLPRAVETGAGTTGISGGLPLIRRYALDRDPANLSVSPVTPGVAGGNINGELPAEGAPWTAGAAISIANVGSARSWQLPGVYAKLARAVLDWADDAGRRVLDQILLDVADRRAETYIGAELIAAAGGTRAAAAGDPALLDALNAAESAAGAALNDAVAAGTVPGLLVVNPTNLPRVRRAVGTSWPAGFPHPEVAVSIGTPAGTVIVVGPGAVHLFRADPIWSRATVPAGVALDMTVARPTHVSIRIAAGVQTVTAVPA